jgi:hypothetical protein
VIVVDQGRCAPRQVEWNDSEVGRGAYLGTKTTRESGVRVTKLFESSEFRYGHSRIYRDID